VSDSVSDGSARPGRPDQPRWQRLASETILKTPIFSFRVDRCKTSSGREMPRYYLLDFPDWVQVVATDTSQNIILVRQYRYPADISFLELPGGSLDPQPVSSAPSNGGPGGGPSTEDPLSGAQRELLEETGYSSDDWHSFGFHYPNPAMQTNRCHVFWAKNCVKTAELSLDPFEELEPVIMPLAEFKAHLRSSAPKHALMLASFAMVFGV
jgi:8-oxo-dGTP pyrophosphatase MutT (NUDIX family)